MIKKLIVGGTSISGSEGYNTIASGKITFRHASCSFGNLCLVRFSHCSPDGTTRCWTPPSEASQEHRQRTRLGKNIYSIYHAATKEISL